jgi:hypothetical protein
MAPPTKSSLPSTRVEPGGSVLRESPEGQNGTNSTFTHLQTKDQTEGQADTPVSTSQPSQVMTNSRRDSNSFTDSLSAIRQQLNRSTVPEFLLHLPTMLVEYYFNYVCQIFSSFDGTLNPFRSTVGKLWDGSAPIYYAIQSMAAAYLANHFPRMSPVGIQMQRETYRYLYQSHQGANNTEDLDKKLLTVLLVGQTTAWHDPKDLGLVHLKMAKRLNRRRMEHQLSQWAESIGSRERRQNDFFEQCILYWDMLAGFVEDDVDEFDLGDLGSDDSATSPQNDSVGSNQVKKKVFPHPWTGIAPKVQRLFAQVGRLIRSYRMSTAQDVSSLDFLSMDMDFDIQYLKGSLATIEIVAKAQSLEEELLAFEPPSISSLVDAGDENTPVQQYIYLAEAYRCAALLEIYRIFPSILVKRVPLTNNTFASHSSLNPNQETFTSLPIPIDNQDDFLISLALHTISLLERLPSNSGTRCLQPIVIIAAASELRFSSSSSSSDPMSSFLPSGTVFGSITSREIDIAAARRFVVKRLQEFQLSLPAKPIVLALRLVEETWKRSDEGKESFWMDIIGEMGWASIFG